MSTYCTRTNVESRYGVDNVSTWADLDNDQDADKILARITEAITAASEEIDDIMRDGPYAIPLVKVGGATPSVTVIDIASVLAGAWLYDARNVDDAEEDGKHRFGHLIKQARRKLNEIYAGRRRLDSEPAATVPQSAPVVVPEDDWDA